MRRHEQRKRRRVDQSRFRCCLKTLSPTSSLLCLSREGLTLNESQDLQLSAVSSHSSIRRHCLTERRLPRKACVICPVMVKPYPPMVLHSGKTNQIPTSTNGEERDTMAMCHVQVCFTFGPYAVGDTLKCFNFKL
jgi:hypothetical protein